MASQRVLDLAVAIPIAIITAPLMLAVAVAVWLTSGWPILIRQTRVGAGERPIAIWKFRTMAIGVPLVAKSELRPTDTIYTPLGRTLRRWSLDELPQLANVIIGDMSLVGPRPALPTQHDLLALRRRHGVTGLRPGLTGLAQVAGRESLTLSTKVRFEAVYARRASLCFDVAIILRTPRAMLSRRGAY